jgi:hypothetical protein
MIIMLLCAAMITTMLIATAIALHNEASQKRPVRRVQF